MATINKLKGGKEWILNARHTAETETVREETLKKNC